MSVGGRRLPVLVAAAGEAWETVALELLEREGRLVLHHRSVDLHDLVASAATGLARCALVAETLPGLDADAVAGLRRSGVGAVVVAAGASERFARMGAGVVAPDLDGVVTALLEAAEETATPGSADGAAAPGPGATTAASAAGADRADDVRRPARVVAVWGPTGAPGRTTLATGIAAEMAARGQATLLVDADPYGGAVAQHLGVLDEVSGLLAAARRANAGELGPGGLAEVARTVGEDLRVLTGLPRPDRWSEVRPTAFEEVLDAAEQLVDRVVVDVGFSLEDAPGDPFASAPRRNETTLATLERAHDVVAVGSADPVGLARLARGLVDLAELVPGAAVHVVVNRTRASLGWSEAEVTSMIEGFGRPVAVHHVAEDRTTADRALMTGRSLVELGDSPLRRGVAAVTDLLAGPAAPGARGRRAVVRRLRRPQLPKSR